MNPAKYVSLGIYFGIGFAIVNILGNCGGGGGVSSNTSTVPQNVTPATYDYRDYATYRQSVIRFFSGGQYSATVISPSEIDIKWGDKDDDSVEEHRIRGDYVYVDAYRSGKYRWQSVATRAEINYGQGWQTLDPQGSSLYGPVIVPQQGFVLRQWGCIKNDPKYQDDKCGKLWFHQHRVTHAGRVYNSCWQGIGDSTREALKQEEVWWDSVDGWFRGSGAMKDGIPTGDVTMDFYQLIGRDAGFVWQGSGGVCLIR